MTPAANTLLSLIIVSLGIVSVILSFLVPDRKKSLIALGLAGVVVITGLFQLTSQSLTEYRWNKRMKEIQKERQVDLEELRERLQQKTQDTAPAPEKKK